MSGSLALETAHCPGCDQDQATLVYQATDVIYGMDPHAFPVVRCGACGIAYLRERPTREAIAGAYPDHYFWRLAKPVAPPGAPLNDRLVALYFRQFYARRAAIADRLRPAGPLRALDLGCGEGGFLAALAARRTGELTGIDFSVGEAPSGVRLHAGDLNALAPVTEAYDLITLWHVLEHLHDPRAVLAWAQQALTPGGTLVVATQNFDALSRRWMGSRWPLNDIPRHLYHFTPASLRRLVTAVGFEQTRTTGWTEYFPALGGHLTPRWTVRPDGRLRALPGMLLSLAFAPIELAAIALGAGCTFTLTARRP